MEKQKIYFANQTNTKVYNKVQSQMENNKNPFCKLAVAKLISQQPTSLGHSCFCFFFYFISYLLHSFLLFRPKND